MKTKIGKILVGFIILTFVLSACATPATQAPTVAPTKPVAIETAAPIVAPTTAPTNPPTIETAAPTAAPTEAPKPTGKITLWGWSYDAMQSTGLVDDFQKEYPDIQLDFVKYSSTDTYQNLQLAISAGTGAPDVVQIENSHLAQFVDIDGLMDITDRVQPYIPLMNAYKWVDAVKDGKYYAMPWDSGPVVLYYRRDVFKAAGLSDVPDDVSAMVATWDKYLETCTTIKDKTGKNCFAFSRANNDARIYEIALWQQGLGYYDKDGNVTVDSAQNVATLETLGKFWNPMVVSEEQAWTDPWYAELNSPDNSVASIVEASWMGIFLKTWIAGGTAGMWGVAEMPTFADGQVRAANDGGSTLAISSQSQNPDAAWAFIEYMLGRDDSQLRMFAYTDFLPSLETTYTDALFYEPDTFFGSEMTRQLYLKVAKEIPTAYVYGPNYQLMNGYVATAIQEYATGKSSAADALKAAADRIRAETGMP
jgi:ABC-type glycerol-3-phosphate transport system substrate-binding protein